MTTGQGGVIVRAGIAPGQHLAAAGLWWRGMGQGVLPFVPPRAGISWARAALRPQAALTVHDRQGRLIGLAGLRDGGGGLIDWAQPMRPMMGPLAGPLARLALRLWLPGPPTPDLVLDGLAVHLRAARRGVARALVRAALDEARARHRPGLTVEVLATNGPARALYTSEGFVPVARLRMGHGRAALVLRRDCAGPSGLPPRAAPLISGPC